MKQLVGVVFVGLVMVGCGSKHGVAVSGSQITVTSGDVKAKLATGDPVEETFVLFGDDEGVLFGDSLVSGLPIRRARQLYARYPDLGHCKSSGSGELHSQMGVFNLVAGSSPVRKVLESTRATARQRVGTDASRVCLSVTGKQLSVLSIEEGGTAVTFDDAAVSGHVLVESASMQDCTGLL